MDCLLCKKKFKNTATLYKHNRNLHQLSNERLKEVYECATCSQKFYRKTEIRSHVMQHITFRRRNIICPLCDERFSSSSCMRNHLQTTHTIDMNPEHHTFYNIKEFENWKGQMERKTNSSYIIRAGELKTTFGSRTYYLCHRSSFSRIQTHRVRRLKSSGSNKIEATCPSMVICRKFKNKVTVEFYPTHVGHKCEIGRIRLSKNDRATIAGSITEGVSTNAIMRKIRDSGCSNNFNRVHMIEKKDINNIIRDFSLNYSTRRHQDDATSVGILVDSLNEKDDSPVIYYKQVGVEDKRCGLEANNFVLILMTRFQEEMLLQFGNDKICIDGTHGLNNYGIDLYSIVVLDEYGNGVPCAFCFSDRGDSQVLIFCFQKIKEKLGKEIKCKVFMSDDAPQLYNAWSNVMGEAEYKLLCTWHVNKNWVSKSNVIKDAEKRKSVQKTLKVLRSETDEKAFNYGLEQFLKMLAEDDDTKSFGTYFLNFYAHRATSWAFCYRIHLGINTNMVLESLHKRIKHLYLDGKKCKRLDKAIGALLDLSKDTIFERIIKLTKHKVSEKLRRIQKSHDTSKNIQNDMIMTKENNIWYVTSSSDVDRKYLVQKLHEACTQELCGLKCNVCFICVHMYKCSCFDNLIYFNICKHIHACARKDTPITEEIEKCESIEKNINFLDKSYTSDDNEDILALFKTGTDLVSKAKLDITAKMKIKRHIEKAISLLQDSQKSELIPTTVMNSKSNVSPQKRFVNKNKARRSNTLPIPSTAENKGISLMLKGVKRVEHVHSSWDHSYC